MPAGPDSAYPTASTYREAMLPVVRAHPGGPGAHVASGNFMVAPGARGRGVGRALGDYLLDWARANGFRGVQFNAVAASNTPAVGLYERLGFSIIGTVPGAFWHPTQGPVGLHVMYHDLS